MSLEGKAKNIIVGVVLGLLLLLGIIGLAVVVGKLHSVPGCTMLQYGVVIDAGSSKSELSVLRWPGEKSLGTGVVTNLVQCRNEKGIAKYATPDEAAKSLEKCIKDNKMIVPEDRRNITPIYLGATAGMRLLELESKEKANKILESVRTKLSNSGYVFKNDNARILTEQEEGMFAWIAANFLQNTLGQDGERKPTLGTLDLGGASTQIAFEIPERSANANPEDQVTKQVYGNEFLVYTHSYQCFGADEIERRFLAELALASTTGKDIQNPCLQNSYKFEVLAKNIFGQLCTQKAPDYIKSEDFATFNLTFTGAMDIAKCKALVEKLLNPATCAEDYTYCLNATFVPKLEGKFVALSSFFFAASFFNVSKGTSEDFKKSVEKYCNLDWTEVEDIPESPGTTLAHRIRYCFLGNYLYKLLSEVYKFDTEEKWKDITFTSKVNGVAAGWNLGFMTSETNSIPTESTGSPIPESVYAGLVSLFVFIIIGVLVTAVVVYSRNSCFPCCDA